MKTTRKSDKLRPKFSARLRIRVRDRRHAKLGCMKAAASMLALALVLAADFQAERVRMVNNQIEARGVTDAKGLAAMLKGPRHDFVPEGSRDAAYDDGPLPIRYGQTISQPDIGPPLTAL